MKINYSTLLLLVFAVTTVNAEEDTPWSIKGFGTFGFAGTDTDKLGFYRSRTQTQDLTNSLGITTDSRLGLQVDVDINQSLHATVQWVARDHTGDFFEQNLDWAFIRWDINAATNIRVGRIGADVFLLSDYRNVGYASLWARPPHEFYSQLAFYHFDGFDFNHKLYFNDSLLSIKIFSGYGFNQVQTPSFGKLDIESPAAGVSLKFESEDWTFRVGYAYLRFVSDVPNEQLVGIIKNPLVNFGIPGIRQVIPYLSLKDANIHFYSLGAAYDNGVWTAQAEASYVDTDLETNFLPDTASAYLSIGRRISDVTVYSLFGISRSFQNDIRIPSQVIPSPQLEKLHNFIDEAINNNGIDEKSISLGLRWDFYQNVALKAQWSHYWLGPNGTQFWEDPTAKEKSREVNVWSLGFDFIF